MPGKPEHVSAILLRVLERMDQQQEIAPETPQEERKEDPATVGRKKKDR